MNELEQLERAVDAIRVAADDAANESVPDVFERRDMIREAEILAATGRFGETPQEVYAKMVVADDLGVPIGPALQRGMYDIDGKISFHYTLVATLLRRAGWDYAVVFPEPTVCEVYLLRDGQVVKNPVTGEEVVVRVTLKEMVERGIAKNTSGGLKSAWAAYPKRMLFSHAINALVHIYVPEVLYTTESQ